jgi:membrane protein YqaA with SNARE-associated domain
MWYELLSLLASSFILNLIPFAGPSNLLIASSAALLIDSDPFTIGFLVALGSAAAKFIHYVVTFFISGHIGKERRERLDAVGSKYGRWASLALFVVAATPLPDEPVVIPLGLLKYNPIKFFLAFFAGKLSITVAGAYFAKTGEALLAPWLTQEALIVMSIVLTIAITVLLLKVDVVKLAEKVLKRKIA